MSSRGTNIICSYDRVIFRVGSKASDIFSHTLSLSPSLFLFPLIYLGAREELGHLLPSTMWPMPYFAKVCHIIRIDVKSKDFGTALAMWESWHRCAHRPTCINKSIKPTTPASHSPKQVFFIASVLSLSHASVFSLRELIWHRSKVGDPDWGTRWAMEGHRCQMHHKWIWHVFWPT